MGVETRDTLGDAPREGALRQCNLRVNFVDMAKRDFGGGAPGGRPVSRPRPIGSLPESVNGL